MRFSSAVIIVAGTASQALGKTGDLGDAVEVKNNPVGAIYRATLGVNPFLDIVTPAGGPVQGSIVATVPTDGEGVEFTVDFQNLPVEGGPFSYHLHVDPVPDDGDCTKTLAHLDPFIRGEDPVCDSAAPETCQVGDLSGKNGKIPDGSDVFTDSYPDAFLALYEGPGAFFGNRSFVLHFANKTRIACANFVLESAGISSGEDGNDDDHEECPGGAEKTAPTYGNATTTLIVSSTSSTPSAGLPTTTSSTAPEDPAPTSDDAPITAGASATSFSMLLFAATSFAAVFFCL